MVLDTSVLIAGILAKSKQSTNLKIIELWKDGHIQLVISATIKKEYLTALDYIDLPLSLIIHWNAWFSHPQKVTKVPDQPFYQESRDPKDNKFLDAAKSGQAHFLITRDKDLLEINKPKKLFSFTIVTPEMFLD